MNTFNERMSKCARFVVMWITIALKPKNLNCSVNWSNLQKCPLGGDICFEKHL